MAHVTNFSASKLTHTPYCASCVRGNRRGSYCNDGDWNDTNEEPEKAEQGQSKLTDLWSFGNVLITLARDR